MLRTMYDEEEDDDNNVI